MNIQNSTGCYLNESIKTAVLIEDGILIAFFCYAKKQIQRELLLLNIQQSDAWEGTTEYHYVTPDPDKGWNQPLSGLKHKSSLDYLPTTWNNRIVSVEDFLNL